MSGYTDAPSHDSFLDIVANMVGILIILVMVVGVRVKNAPVATAIPAAAEQDVRELHEDMATEQSLRGDVLKMAEQIKNLQRETSVRRQRRDVLATIASGWEHEIELYRQQMDNKTKMRFDLDRELAQLRFELEQLDHKRVHMETVAAKPNVVESYPTPLSQTVAGREGHFQLRDERIVAIPLEELIEQLKDAAQRRKYKLLELPEVTGTVGPLGGFRLRYSLVRVDVSPEVALQTGRGGAYAKLKRWTLIPVSNQLGEPIEAALREGSEFRRAISLLDPDRSTVTIWTYPDSFASFRRVKKELFRQGFATAARPLPHDVPISGSPLGSKSAAQ